MDRWKNKGLCSCRFAILMVSLDTKLKVLIFFQKFLGKDAGWVCDKLHISRATFYRHKKKLYGKMVITKR